MSFEQELICRSEGVTAYGAMNDCYRYGIVHGCTTECPVLIRGEFELKDDENKDLWEEVKSL